MAHIVILGAGLTGISAAYHLEKNGFTDYKMFEKESTPGGLCRSVQQDGFTFDYTGHLLHTSDAYFRGLIEQLVGLENMNVINRRSYIYSHDTYTKYPYQINLHGLPTSVIADCIEGYVKRNTKLKNPKTFSDWVDKNFGSGLKEHFFYPYQRKIFAFPPEKLSATWTGRFVPSTSLEQIIAGALKTNEDESVGYNAQFLYPKEGGIFAWVDKLAQQLHQKVFTNFCVESIDMQLKVVHFTNGHVEPFEELITTLPLDTFLNLLVEPASSSLKRASDKLLCNSVVNFNIGVNHPNLSDKHWIYYPEKQYPFYRMGFPHNFASSLVPEGCSSLYGEFAHRGASPRTVNEKLTASLREAKKLLGIAESDIATEKIIHIKHAYVIFDGVRDKLVSNLLATLEQSNIHSVGRYGAWKYSSMQEGVLDGKKIAETLLDKELLTKKGNTHVHPSLLGSSQLTLPPTWKQVV